MPYAIPTVPDHLKTLAANMREADRQELAAGSGSSPLYVLEEGYVHSPKCLSIFTDRDELVGIFGVAPNLTDRLVGHPWMLATDHLDSIRMTFLRQSRKYLDALGEGYALLMNCCDKRNTTHIKWLKWLGFSFIREIPDYGVGRVPFLEFVKIGDSNV